MIGAAAFYGHVKVMRHLEAKLKFVNINYAAQEKVDKAQKGALVCEFAGYTPAMLAVAGGHVEILTILLHNNCDLSPVDTYGNNLALIAVLHGRTEVFKYIIDNLS